MLLAPILPVVPALGGCALLYYCSGRKRTGILHALGFGLLAFAWQTLLYRLLLILTEKYEWLQQFVAAHTVFMALAISLIYSILIAVCLFWAVGTVNRKEHSVIRAAAAGIGFSLGNVIWNILIPYVSSLYYAARINTGSFKGSDELAWSVYYTTPLSVMSDSLKGIYMVILYMTLAYLAERERSQKKYMRILLIFLVQYFLSVSSALLNFISGNGYWGIIIQHVLLILLSGAGVYLLYRGVWVKERLNTGQEKQ